MISEVTLDFEKIFEVYKNDGANNLPRSSALELLETAVKTTVQQGATTPEAVLEKLRDISEKDFWRLWKGAFPGLASREGYFDRVWGNRDKFLASRGEYFENIWGGEKFLVERIGKILEKRYLHQTPAREIKSTP